MALKLKHSDKDVEIRFSYMWDDDLAPETIPLSSRPRRRCSIAELFINGELIARGIAICHPQDNFSKIMGRKIALVKPLAPLDKLRRRAIWEKYIQLMKI